MGKIRFSAHTAAIGAVTAGLKAAKNGGTGKDITQAAVKGAGVPSFGGKTDEVVGKVYDATAQGIKTAAPVVKDAVVGAVGRTAHFVAGLGRKDDNA
jgi:hypothetical protein